MEQKPQIFLEGGSTTLKVIGKSGNPESLKK